MQSRRAFLGTSAGVATVAIAGCSGSDNDGNGGDDGGNSNSTDDGPTDDGGNQQNGDDDGTEQNGNESEEIGRYADFIVETDERPLTATIQKVGELVTVEDYRGASTTQTLFGVTPADVELSLGVSSATAQEYGVFIASFGYESVRADVEERFDSVSDGEDIGSFRTLEGSTGSGSSILYGVSSEALVVATGRETLERAIGSVNGDESLLIDSSENFATMADIVGDPTFGQIQLEPDAMKTDPADSAVAGGLGIDIREGQSEYTRAIMYETESEATENESEIGDIIVENQSGVDSVETRVEGRTVIVTGSATTSEL